MAFLGEGRHRHLEETPEEPELPTPRLGVHHLAVVVADLARAEDFYTRVLGLSVIQRFTDAKGKPRSVWVTVGWAFLAIEIAHAEGPRRDNEAPGWHCVALCIQPEERETWTLRLRDYGIALERETDYSIFFRDPDGNLLALSHYPALRPYQERATI
jgi:catechol 2,3-dioxygenase-like lactoylglutathione lyase family enzyme